MRSLFWLPLLGALVNHMMDVSEAKSKHVTVTLDAKWPTTPTILETSEFLANENNDYFWRFIEELVKLSGGHINHDEEWYRFSLKLAGRILTPIKMNLLKFALSLRAHSPAIQMNSQLAVEKRPQANCEVFLEVNNMMTCEEFALTAFIQNAETESKPTLVKSDHIYPGSSDRDIVAILYADISGKSFISWHKRLIELADDGKITYVLRHYVKNQPEKKLRLSGYGVELAIKNTEYKAQDDTKVKDTSDSGSDEDDEDELQGFMFNTLRNLHPDLTDNLNEFRQYLKDSTNDLAPLKVWQMQDLSYQAAQRVMAAPQEDKLRLLRDISQNFPSMARSLVKTAVNSDLRNEITKNQQQFQSAFGLDAGESAMFINGVQADLDVYDMFTLLDTMKSEAKLMEGLYQLGNQYEVSNQAMMDMLRLDLRDTDSNYAVDMRDDSVIYLNDLEKDKRYSGWPASVQDILRPTFPGMLRHVRKNLFNVVFMVNPAEKEHKDLLKMAEAFFVHSAPIRIGLLFVVNPDPELDGTQDAGVAMLRAFNFIRKQESATKALSFITDVYEHVVDEEITAEFIAKEFQNYFGIDPLVILEGYGGGYDDPRVVYEKASSGPLSADTVLGQFQESFPAQRVSDIFASATYDKSRQAFESLDDSEKLTHSHVESELSDRGHSSAQIQDIVKSNEYATDTQQAAEFFERTGLGSVPQVLVNGAPMKPHELDPDEFEEAVVTAIMRQTSMLQNAVYNGQLTDKMNILDFLMTRNNVMPRLNSRVLSPTDLHISLITDMPEGASKTKEKFRDLTTEQMSGALKATLKYLTKKEESTIYSVTNWIVGDMNTPEGRAILYAAIKHLKHATETRLTVIHNPTELPGGGNKGDIYIPTAIQAALESLEPAMAKSFVTKLLKKENVEALRTGEKTLEELAVHNMDFAAYDKTRQNKGSTFLFVHRIFADKVLGFQPGERGVVSNGKVLGPLKPTEVFIQEDFDLLDKYTARVSGSKVEKKVEHLGLSDDKASELTMQIASLLTSVSQRESRKEVPFWNDIDSVIKLPSEDNTEPAYDIVAILDPTTRAAQKYTPVLMVLQEVANVNLKVYMNCREKLSEMPLKSYYRFVLEPELEFAVDSSTGSGPFANFQNMPESPLLTLGMDPPESWLVEAVRTPYDLDNIFLAEVDSTVKAEFELEYLLLEGHCYDSVSSQPPRGLQFILGTNKTQDIQDTIVMANLGYFQLKASPGMWNLRMREGRSRDIYEITSHEMTDSPSNSPNIIVVMDSFKSKIIRIRVGKKPGKEQEDLLGEEEPNKQGGLWDSISNTITGGSNSVVKSGTDDTINIFSLASGHLYERLLRIMMLSVIKNTKSKVKFWYLKNYLSPSFMDFIPHMAEKYGFDYQLVQYKWPRWLHQQTEKQRIIWGYKILFLDVLFPLNVDKFIFVDADQIVRADLQELVDFDLQGAPYGYVPFCDSRKEMDGFRFWKSGYWASHLAGRKYHISALYVVDLKKFRKVAAGDRLRGQYQGLSQDPNSLSNLDQDLPNNMIHQVNIKSLPQEWLYCDTWCHESELPNAKTIDLCNNPKTKEPKLVAAARIAPEWTGYDMEIKMLWDKIYGTNTANINIKDDTKSSQTDKKDPDHIEL